MNVIKVHVPILSLMCMANDSITDIIRSRASSRAVVVIMMMSRVLCVLALAIINVTLTNGRGMTNVAIGLVVLVTYCGSYEKCKTSDPSVFVGRALCVYPVASRVLALSMKPATRVCTFACVSCCVCFAFVCLCAMCSVFAAVVQNTAPRVCILVVVHVAAVRAQRGSCYYHGHGHLCITVILRSSKLRIVAIGVCMRVCERDRSARSNAFSVRLIPTMTVIVAGVACIGMRMNRARSTFDYCDARPYSALIVGTATAIKLGPHHQPVGCHPRNRPGTVPPSCWARPSQSKARSKTARRARLHRVPPEVSCPRPATCSPH